MKSDSQPPGAGEKDVLPGVSPRIFPLILDNLEEGVFSVNSEFRITFFNAAAERITGISREQAIGRKCYEVLRANICQTSCAMKRTLKTGQPLRHVRVEVLNNAMDPVPLCVSTAALRDDEGRLLGGVEIFQDLTEVESLKRIAKGQRGFGDIVGRSVAMRRIFHILPDVAVSDASVLITGASGTGKELIATAIHELSRRKDGPLIKVNCGALPDTLLESELFGYVKGAFTDAKRDKPGRFVLADHGTLFLDEVGELSPAFQVKLLRVLQEGEVQPLGSTETRKVDVRIVAATNRDLAEEVRARRFREDLFYRLRVVAIEMPPLVERREDIPLLVDHFVQRQALKSGKPIEGVTAAALKALQAYDYPGNVRELENIIARAFVFCHGSLIDVRHLPAEVTQGRATREQDGPATGYARPDVSPRDAHGAISRDPLKEASDRSEVQVIRQALDEHHWNRTETARALGIGRNTLWRKMKKYGLLDERRR